MSDIHASAESGSLRIQRLSPGNATDLARWDRFVAASADATFFHRAGWQRILTDVFRHRTFFLYVESAGEIVGILPLAQVKSRLFGNSLTALPFAVYGGIVTSDPAVGALLEAEAEKIARELDVQHLEYRNVRAKHSDWPRQTLYVTFRKEILPDEEANMLAIPRKQRAMVRKSQKNGLRSVVDPDARRFFDLYADNVRRHGTPALPRAYFDALLDEFGENCSVLTVEDAEGIPVSSVVSFYFRDEVLPYYAGDHVRARQLAANDFKYWELMRRSCAAGLKVFDYGRSKVDSGSYSFKRNWGFEPTPLNYEYRLYKRDAIPQNNPNNPKYKLLINTWKRLPLAFANRLGPLIVRNLG